MAPDCTNSSVTNLFDFKIRSITKNTKEQEFPSKWSSAEVVPAYCKGNNLTRKKIIQNSTSFTIYVRTKYIYLQIQLVQSKLSFRQYVLLQSSDFYSLLQQVDFAISTFLFHTYISTYLGISKDLHLT